MQFGRQMVLLMGTLTLIFNHLTSKHVQMVEVQNSAEDIVPAPFSLAQQ
jgi:hypothetical protein